MMAVSKSSIAAAGLLLVLMLGSAAAFEWSDVASWFSDSKPVQCTTGSGAASAWIAIAWVTVFIGVFFNAGATALGGVLGGQKYNEFLKGGLWGVIETAGILSIFTLGFVGLKDWGEGNLDRARAYATIIRNNIVLDFGMVVGASTLLSFISRQNPSFRIPIIRAFGLSFQVAPMLRPLFDGLGMFVQLLAAAVAEWVGHEFFFCFIKTNMLVLLLPIGLFLRVLGIRGGGNALIALAVSLYFIYPYLMVLSGEMITNSILADLDTSSAPHIWPACNGPKPICCIGNAVPETYEETFIRNGYNWQTLDDRIAIKPVLEGDIALSYLGVPLAPVLGTGATCIFNTGLAKAFGGLMEIMENLGVLGVAGGAGVFAAAGFVLTRIFNISYILLILIPPIMGFMVYSVFEFVFFLFMVSLILPILMIFVTITMAKEVSKALGTEIDLSSLEKLI